jgi:hypothetical protein
MDWTQVTVVFHDRRPSLFINGLFVRAGLRCTEAVHPGVGVAVPSPYPVVPFQGWLAGISQSTKTLDEDEIAQLAAARPEALPAASEAPAIKFAAATSGALRVQVWEPGRYELHFSDGAARTLPVAPLPSPLDISGPWTIHFPKGRGAPAEIELTNLISWTEYPSGGVRHFSGTAVYETEFNVPADFAPNHVLALDLGEVQVIAEPVLNGRELGVLWKPPFRVEVTNLLKPGRNRLEVRLTNLWPNRLIGDEQYPDDCAPQGVWKSGSIPAWPAWLRQGRPRLESRRFAFATFRYWDSKSPLLPSGLLGPVTIQAAERVEVR